MEISDMPDVYIYLENMLIENIGTINMQGIIQALQCFRTKMLHSMKLFVALFDRLFILSS
jgi:hypothetical protein